MSNLEPVVEKLAMQIAQLHINLAQVSTERDALAAEIAQQHNAKASEDQS